MVIVGTDRVTAHGDVCNKIGTYLKALAAQRQRRAVLCRRCRRRRSTSRSATASPKFRSSSAARRRVATMTGRTADGRIETRAHRAGRLAGRELRLRRDAGAARDRSHHRARRAASREGLARGAAERRFRDTIPRMRPLPGRQMRARRNERTLIRRHRRACRSTAASRRPRSRSRAAPCGCCTRTASPCVSELPLPSGRRADLVALGRGGEIWIVEIKSSIADFRADQKWMDYRAALRPAVLRNHARGAVRDFPEGHRADRRRCVRRADSSARRRNTDCLRATRKIMMLAFAQCAALRLQSLIDPAGPYAASCRDRTMPTIVRPSPVCAVLLFAGPAASARRRAYAGKTVSVIIGFGPGGGYDLWGRLVARHIGKHLPGKPNGGAAEHARRRQLRRG